LYSAEVVTSTGTPAIWFPACLSPAGLPVGIQIVGKYRGDLALLKIANAFEQATNIGSRRPPIVQ
jgi:amidase